MRYEADVQAISKLYSAQPVDQTMARPGNLLTIVRDEAFAAPNSIRLP